MAQILYAGGELDSVSNVTGTVTEVTTAGTFDSTYARASMQLNGNASLFRTPFLDSSCATVSVTTGQTLYVHGEIYVPNTGVTAQNAVEILDGSGNPWLAIRSTTSSATWGIYGNTGTGASPVWTLIGSTFTFNGATKYAYDLKVTLGSPHAVEFSLGGSLTASGTFTAASFTAAASAQYRGATWSGSSFNFNHSQMMATEGLSTIGSKVKTTVATGAGSNSGWTGAATDVNEIPTNDTTVNTAASAGLTQTYAWGSVTVPSGLSIKSVFQWTRGKNDGASPLNIKAACKSGTTTYNASANMPGIGTSFAALAARWDTDPATSAAWTQTGLNAAQFGMTSAA